MSGAVIHIRRQSLGARTLTKYYNSLIKGFEAKVKKNPRILKIKNTNYEIVH